MNFNVITGMSGSGKTQALHILEDVGYYCVDNIPVEMLDGLKDKVDRNIAVVCDIRTGDVKKLIDCAHNVGARVIFLDTEDGTIVKRYKETRRNHPLESGEGLLSAIAREREILEPIKGNSYKVIDTTKLSLGELRGEIMSALEIGESEAEFEVSLMSFGFKNGVPQDADMLFDVRCFPNPFYVEELKHKTGNDKDVQDYVLSHKNACEYLAKIIDMVSYVVPIFEKEGRYSLVVAIGCTGGHHRSVTFANKVGEELKDRGIKVNISHREI